MAGKVIEKELIYKKCSKVIKSGTARSKYGAEKDRGVVVHLIDSKEPNGYWGGKTICGAEPGKRSNGWFEASRPVSCDKCLKKLKPFTP